jgi:hypothetical protein
MAVVLVIYVDVVCEPEYGDVLCDELLSINLYPLCMVLYDVLCELECGDVLCDVFSKHVYAAFRTNVFRT